MKTVKIALLGLGNVGTGTYSVLEMNREQIEAAVGAHIMIDKILTRDAKKKRTIDVSDDQIGVLGAAMKDKKKKRTIHISPEQLTQNYEDIVNDPEIDIVVEVMGGVEPATTYMLDAMRNKKHVVTANKAALAANFDKLKKCAEENNVMFRFEASVAGGIPILSAITSVLRGNQFYEVMGIINGTTNYMLTQMTDHGLAYDDVLKIAQEKGFAEADPTDDVEGIDVANKLTILIYIMFNKYVKPGDIPTEGISKITKEQIEDAKAQGCKIKLIANARYFNGEFECSVKPTLLRNDHPLCGVNNEFNAVFIRGNAVGDLMFYGKGAGPLPTGSAVVGDVIEIAQRIND